MDSLIGAPLRSPWFWEVLFLTPRYDASIPELVDAVGADHMVFGSDWPHGGGCGTPLARLTQLGDLAITIPSTHRPRRHRPRARAEARP